MTSALILLPAIDSDLPLILPLTPTLTLTLILTPIQTLILTLTLTLILGTSTLTSRVARSRRAGAQLARGRYRSFLLPHPSHRPHAALLLPRPLRQALRLERCGCEAAYTGRDAPLGADAPGASHSVVCHGDILCVRAHTGRLLRLDATEGGLPVLSATAESHEDAQRWEVLLA